MNGYAATQGSAGWRVRIGTWLLLGADALRTIAEHVDGWLAARRRAAEDLNALDAMSDYELRDIGVARASVREVAQGRWLRDDVRV